MKYLFFLLSVSIVLLQSCGGNDDLTELEQANLNATCFQNEGRDVVAIFEDIEAVVVHPSINNCDDGSGGNEGPYLINGLSQLGPMFNDFGPCNLQEEFKTDADSVSIIMSGYVFEIFEEEIVCARAFEITEIRLSQNQ